MQIKVGLGESGLANLALNRIGLEIKTFIDIENACVDTTEDDNWLFQQINAGKVILLPYREELYPYKEALADFFEQYELLVPKNVKPEQFLAERGLMQTFYDFYECKIVEKLLKWGKQNQMEFIDE